MKESTREEFLTLAMQKCHAEKEKRNVSSGQVWTSIAEKLRIPGAVLNAEESDALRHEALKKIAYLKELKETGRESSTIKLRLLEEAYTDQYGELPK